jgi:hypothetical protein
MRWLSWLKWRWRYVAGIIPAQREHHARLKALEGQVLDLEQHPILAGYDRAMAQREVDRVFEEEGGSRG